MALGHYEVAGAVQGFMVIALKGSSSLGAYDQTSIDRRLAARRAFDEARAKCDASASHAAEQEILLGDVRLASSSLCTSESRPTTGR